MPSGSDTSLALLAGALLAGLCLGIGPCGPVPGGALSGTVRTGPVADWSFANEVPRCAVEVRPAAPHSVTVNCMAWRKRLFVSCSECEGKRWSGHALADPNGRIRVGESVHPVRIVRVTDPGLLGEVWRARAAKIGELPGARPADGWWTFEITSR